MVAGLFPNRPKQDYRVIAEYSEPVEDEKMEISSTNHWCEHIYLNDISKSFFVKPIWPMPEDSKFCPICAAPRPKELSLREKVAKAMADAQDEYDTDHSIQTYWKTKADIAIQVIEAERIKKEKR